MKTKVKICGIQFKEEIEIINKLSIDYIGFIFAPSKRRVSVDQAKILKDMLNNNIKTVGVFVNEASDVVNNIAQILNLDVIQLHGQEDGDYISTIEKQVWKAYKIDTNFKADSLIKNMNITGNLFDGKKPGSGEVFNWDLIQKIDLNTLKILAGGLNPENVEKAIKDVHPDIVDVSSGVEDNNKKDEILLKSLIRRIKNV